jgi:pimeloyl-ACP methyl ester carboxylesterase
MSLKIPFGLIYGAESELFSRMTLEYMQELIAQEFPAVAVAGAQHHVFLDKPLEFIDSLRDMLGKLS